MQASIVSRVRQKLVTKLDSTKKYIVACSGGADSLALAEAMRTCGFTFCVGHVEHGLRGAESLHDADLVKNFCSKYQIKFFCTHVQVRAYCEVNKTSLEEGARYLRWQALQKIAAAQNADYILTAHQKDDQAETFLLRLLRGSGTVGLGAIRFERDNILHPLLEFTGAELRQYCRECHVQWCEDSSNNDLSMTRNRVRHQLLPLLAAEYNPNIVETLVRTAAILQEDAAYLDQLGSTATQQCLVKTKDGELACDVKAWYTLPKSLQFRVWQEFWKQTVPDRELSYANLEALTQVCLRRRSGKKVRLPGKYSGLYAYGKLMFVKDEQCLSNQNEVKFLPRFFTWKELARGVEITTAEGTLSLKVQRGMPQALQKNIFLYPWEQLLGKGSGLTLRTRVSGDYFAPYKGNGHKKLQDYFTDCKIPRLIRDKILLLAVAKEILWVCGSRGAAWQQVSNPQEIDWLIAVFQKGENNHE